MKKNIFLCVFFSFYIFCREYPRLFKGYFSQKGQDKFLHQQIFKNKQNGFFVEAGAHDGISFSNTYFFEKYLGWNGICVEPNTVFFEKLRENRQCICENSCIAASAGSMPFLRCKGYMLEMYSGLLFHCDDRHLERISNEIELYGGDKEVVDVPCIPFKDLFRKHNVRHIDFLSLDIEGGEYQALQTIDFDEVVIQVIVVENNFKENVIQDFLLSKGYEYLMRIGKDDIYLLKESDG